MPYWGGGSPLISNIVCLDVLCLACGLVRPRAWSANSLFLPLASVK